MEYRFSMRKWRYIDRDEHREEIREAIGDLSPSDVDRFLVDTPERRADARDHYSEMGPDDDDCDPLLHLAESRLARIDGDEAHAEYSEEMYYWTRICLNARVARDISEVHRSTT
jgi:hypothetical protein